ncbi:hypothetical protein A5724_02885 [Mycobacterium sp. ACS1612]|nr:hypothetical protein A5724_02885 [Mycobacterium sp. ACS1612]
MGVDADDEVPEAAGVPVVDEPQAATDSATVAARAQRINRMVDTIDGRSGADLAGEWEKPVVTALISD